MSKFSIIVTVYNAANVENLIRCLDSIFNQTYDDYEVIIVNDDKSSECRKIIKEYTNKYTNKIISINRKNKEISSVRKKGISKAKGQYILFVDSDDYIAKGLLKTLNSKTKDSPDVIRFQVKEIIHDNKIYMHRELPFETVKGITAFNKIAKYCYVDNIEFYSYRKEFINKLYSKFLRYVDDDFFAFGSFMILQAKKVKSIGYVGYIIENNNNKFKTPIDYLEQYKQFENLLIDSNFDNLKIWQKYIANILIKQTILLKSKEYKAYLSALNKNEVFDLLEQAGLQKWLIRKYPKLYYKFIRNQS